MLVDEVVGHAFSHGFDPDHTRRLAYWAEALDGPAVYSEQYRCDGTSVVRLRSGNGQHEEMDRRAIAYFDVALADTGLDANDNPPSGVARLLRLGDHGQHGALSRFA